MVVAQPYIALIQRPAYRFPTHQLTLLDPVIGARANTPTPMTEPAVPARTFDRAEVEAILLEAARLDEARGPERSSPLARVSGDALTLGEIERAAAEVGISRAAVSAASLHIGLRATHATPRVHVVQEIPGSLSPDALERLADEVRTRIPSARVRVTAEGLEVESGKTAGEPGSLLVKIRSKGAMTTLSVWSAAPVLTRGALAAVAAVGAPAALFPVVASAGGVWPALASALALGAVGVAAGTGIGVAANRWRIARWHERAADAVITIGTSVSALVAEHVRPPVVDPTRDSSED